MQPGQIIMPQDQPKPVGDGAPEPERPAEEPGPGPEPAPTPAPTPEPTHQEGFSAVHEEAQTGGWQFHQEEAAPLDYAPLPDGIEWTASEFIAHEKGAGWYGALVAGGITVAAVDYFLTKDVFSTGVILFATVVFGLFAARKPKTQQYALDRHGIHVGVRSYGFQEFKNFSVIQEGAIPSVVFMPLKRFMPPLTIHVEPGMEDRVVDYLAAILPFEPHRTDLIDGLLRRIHF